MRLEMLVRAGLATMAMTSVTMAQDSTIVETAVDAGTFQTLATALGEAGLVDALNGEGPFTVFAPTDDAFAALGDATIANLLEEDNRDLLRAVLTYHVVPGRLTSAELARTRTLTTLSGQRLDVSFATELRVDEASIVQGNIEASNGVIHVIDSVLMPETRTIPAIAKEAGSFGTLLAAVKAAGLVDTLVGEGPFTVFAPTDDAFAALGTETIESLLLPENRAKLTSILTYHVVPGRVYASDVIGGVEAATVQGERVSVGLKKGGLRVNESSVIAADIEAFNGVIHVIDGVLLPPQPQGRKLIGITYNDHPSSSVRDELRLSRGEGIIVNSVTSGRGAEAAGMRRGDVIISIDGRPATLDALREAKERAGVGGTVQIVIARTLDVEVTVDDH